ncbi:MAG: exodeoxyribonuclease VII large subunit [Phycisphaerales bacterium]|jgi:exodeoxyribonuclease VII large subunit|nr:exodeoxyribonuclease VII large subunit [Phycisphaerales bacterium]
MDSSETHSPPTPLSVTDLSKKIHTVLDGRIGRIDVVGQVNKPSFKHHWYFSLTDGEASIDCAMWASRLSGVQPRDWRPKQGDQVIIRGTIGHFAKYGKTQIYVERMKPAAEEKGVLQQQYEALLKEFREKGCFDERHKKQLPLYPRTIAVITSATSAAVRDVIETARRRWAAVELMIVNVPVQGKGAAQCIAKAIRTVDDAAEKFGIDAVIVTRGGGSLEELWSFNEREVAEATFQANIPIVAAIGHESDTTMIELVADHRASTPTQAAMVLVPDASELSQMVEHLKLQLYTTTRRVVELARGKLSQSHNRISALSSALLHQRTKRLAILQDALNAKQPHAVLRKRQERFYLAEASLQRGMSTSLASRLQRTETLASKLEAIGPQAVLKRGFSLTQDVDGNILRSVNDVRKGQEILSVLADGSVKSKVE